MKILIHRIGGPGEMVEFAVAANRLRHMLADRTDLVTFTNGLARLHCARVDHIVTVRGEAGFSVGFLCGRCGEQFDTELIVPVRRVLAPRPEGGGNLDEDEGSGFYDGHEIDLAPIVLEEIVLAIPGVFLCRPDCPGVAS